MTIRNGANPDDWAHWDLVHGLGDDLLPVVHNYDPAIPSTLKTRGKVPSLYNKDRAVVGIKNWTSLKQSQRIEAWSKEPDYGICIQTRNVRALDIDVTDPIIAADITLFVEKFIGKLPKRYRENSSKCLLAFRLPGEFAKRVIKTKAGAIEFLANGQQFIASGTHDSGVRYQWEGGLPDDIPELTETQLNDLWAGLSGEFGDGTVDENTVYTARRRGETIEKSDPLAEWLENTGKVLKKDRNDTLHIACPWSNYHSSGEDGDGSTSYFPAGTNGYEQGHFHCMHSHSLHDGPLDTSPGAFIEWCRSQGYGVDDFEDSHENNLVVEDSLPFFPGRDVKTGKINATLTDVSVGLSSYEACKRVIKYDEFSDQIMYATCTQKNDWRRFTDVDYTRVRLKLEGIGFKPIGREMIRDAVEYVAWKNRFDSAKLWLSTLPEWDGVSRVSRFLVDYMGTEDTPYAAAVSEYFWSALAGRILKPGIQADMMLILVGEQGHRKTSSIASIVPDPSLFTELSFSDKDDDTIRKMTGTVLAEVAELRGMKTRDRESIKAFVSRRNEEWIPKYKEMKKVYPRRTVFIGTTNDHEFLADPTGERRWLPIMINSIDTEKITKDRLQLWAEAQVLFEINGIMWQAAEELAKAEHHKFKISDSWDDAVSDWLNNPDDMAAEMVKKQGWTTTKDVLWYALGIEAKNVRRADEMRMVDVLKSKGFLLKVRRVEGKLKRTWVLKNVR